MPSLYPPTDSLGANSRAGSRPDFEEFAVDIYEWLSLIAIESPRVNDDDQIDRFLSRYAPPDPATTDAETTELIKITWRGFLSASWAHKAFVQGLLAATSNTWLSFGVSGFHDSWSSDSQDCTVLKLPGAANEYVMWQVARS